jgi:hypothetical protein
MDIVRLVKADAERQLAGALKTRKNERIAAALQQIVESSMPRPSMPHTRVRRAHPAAGGRPHRVWRWVAGTGLVHLVAEALDDYQTIALTAYLTHPGLSGRRETLYRDVTDAPENVSGLVAAAVRQIQRRLG